eukprot:364810-Chlamydomonas_euryale.AAC.7
MVRRRTLQWMRQVLRIDEDRVPRQVPDCSPAKLVADDGHVEKLKIRQGRRKTTVFLGGTAVQFGHAIWKAPVVAPLCVTVSSLNYCLKFKLLSQVKISLAALKL